MIPNYPYFGLPNYMRHMSPTFHPNSNFSYAQVQTQTDTRNNTPFRSQTQPDARANAPFRSQAQPDARANTPFRSQLQPDAQARVQNQSGAKKYSNSKSQNAQAQNSSPMFSILGFDLYFDDILLLCIIFFLYNENVNEPYLFFTLVLLLLN